MSFMFESLEGRRLMAVSALFPVDDGGPITPPDSDTTATPTDTDTPAPTDASDPTDTSDPTVTSDPTDTFVPGDTFLPTQTFAPTATRVVVPTASIASVMTNGIGHGVGVRAKVNTAFTSVVAKLPRKTVKNLAQLSGSIDWGDGSDPTAATFTRGAGGKIKVNGAHTYSATGKYHIVISIYKRPVAVPGQPTPFFILFLGTITSKARVTA